MSELYKAIAGSPITYLSSDISASQTTISIADDSALPDAPNICTIGYGENLETIKYETKSNGVLQNVTRGIEGTPRAWPAGTEVARFFTAYDHNAIINTLVAHQADLNNIENGIGELDNALATHQAESSQKHITESGANTNGIYIKFDNGWAICKSPNLVLEYGSGNVLVCSWVYPVTFIDGAPPYVNHSPSVPPVGKRTDLFVDTVNSTSHSSLRIVSNSTDLFTSGDSVNTIAIAIGRWK